MIEVEHREPGYAGTRFVVPRSSWGEGSAAQAKVLEPQPANNGLARSGARMYEVPVQVHEIEPEVKSRKIAPRYEEDQDEIDRCAQLFQINSGHTVIDVTVSVQSGLSMRDERYA